MDLIDNKFFDDELDQSSKFNKSGYLSSVICLLTNQTHKGIYQKYEQLKKVGNNHDAYVLLHTSDKDVNENQMDSLNRVFTFSDDILNNLGYAPIRDKLLPGSNHFPLLKFYKENSDYDFYWCIEDDVYYNGDWSEFFSFFQKNSSSDFISSHITDFIEKPNWDWWNTLLHANKFISEQQKISSFNPIYRISKKALSYLDEQLKDGWQGHHEVLIPTLLKKEGFIIQDFGGRGKYVAQNCRNRFYNHSGQPYNTASSMRYRPCIGEEEITESFLYHPVKHIRENISSGYYKAKQDVVTNREDTINERLINTIIKNSSFMMNKGLLNGKMGVSILLYNLAEKNEEIDPSGLVLEIIEDIHFDISHDFENGLPGIGWGLEYLFQNGYIEGIVDDILKEFDKYLLSIFYSPNLTIDFQDGLIGMGLYLIKRVDNSRNQTNTKLINKQWLILLVQRIILELKNEVISKILKKFTSDPFCIYSTYPILIYFLFEVYRLDIYNEKVSVMLEKLILPLKNSKSHPKNGIKKLQLAVALSQSLNPKVSSYISECSNQKFSQEEILRIIDGLLSKIDKDCIQKNVDIDDFSFSKGTMGIVFLYMQLFDNTKNESIRLELEFWKKRSLNILERNINIYENEIDKNIGISEGLSGFLITEFFPHVNENQFLKNK